MDVHHSMRLPSSQFNPYDAVNGSLGFERAAILWAQSTFSIIVKKVTLVTRMKLRRNNGYANYNPLLSVYSKPIREIDNLSARATQANVTRSCRSPDDPGTASSGGNRSFLVGGCRPYRYIRQMGTITRTGGNRFPLTATQWSIAKALQPLLLGISLAESLELQ